jgi:hypothetical protein
MNSLNHIQKFIIINWAVSTPFFFLTFLLLPETVLANGGLKLTYVFWETMVTTLFISVIVGVLISLGIKKFLKPSIELLVSVITLAVFFFVPIYLFLASPSLASSLAENKLCSLIRADETLRYQCYFEKNVLSKGPSACEDERLLQNYLQYTYGQNKKDTCYSKFINEEDVLSNNPELCKNIENGGTQRDCLIRAAKLTSDPLLCEFAKTVGYKQDCYNFVYTAGSEGEENIKAVFENDPKLCQRIGNETIARNCLVEIATVTSNPSLCELNKPTKVDFTNLTRVEVCYLAVAQNTQDTKLCEKISVESWKYNCLTGAKSGETYKRQDL